MLSMPMPLLLPYVLRLTGFDVKSATLGNTEDVKDTLAKVEWFCNEARNRMGRTTVTSFAVTVRQTTGQGRMTARQHVATIDIDARAGTNSFGDCKNAPDWVPDCTRPAWRAAWDFYFSDTLGNMLLDAMRSAECGRHLINSESDKHTKWACFTEADLEAYRRQAFERFIEMADTEFLKSRRLEDLQEATEAACKLAHFDARFAKAKEAHFNKSESTEA